jgi:hypothetical protein
MSCNEFIVFNVVHSLEILCPYCRITVLWKASQSKMLFRIFSMAFPTINSGPTLSKMFSSDEHVTAAVVQWLQQQLRKFFAKRIPWLAH